MHPIVPITKSTIYTTNNKPQNTHPCSQKKSPNSTYKTRHKSKSQRVYETNPYIHRNQNNHHCTIIASGHVTSPARFKITSVKPKHVNVTSFSNSIAHLIQSSYEQHKTKQNLITQMHHTNNIPHKLQIPQAYVNPPAPTQSNHNDTFTTATMKPQYKTSPRKVNLAFINK
eukprot:gene3005-1987_t